MPLETGKILNNRYRIVSLLGQGGFGAVYRAWDLNLKRPCAVKENLETNPQSQQQFENEATVLANLYHQHLPRVIDHFVLPGQGQYLVMDFVEGQDLEALVASQGPVDVNQAVEWISQIADALDYLHSQARPVIHRDIKPANIRVASDGRAYLVDFGLVKLYTTQAYTTPGARGVTPGFSPPEQYGHGGTNARSDLYSLAATLYNLLTGVVPPESVHRYTQATLKPVHLLNPSVSSTLSNAIDKAMSLDPDRRYASARDFEQALHHALAPSPERDTLISQPKGGTIVAPSGFGTLVAPTYAPLPAENVLPQRAKSPAAALSQSKLLIGGAAVLLLVICAGLVYALGYFPVKPEQTEEINFAATDARSTEVAWLAANTLTAQAAHTEPATDAVENTPIPTATEPAPPTEQPAFTATAPPSTPENTFTPTAAAAGYDLAFASDRDGEFAVYVMDTGTGEVRQLPRPSGYERAWWPSFCGTRIAAEVQDTGSKEQWIYLLDILGGDAQRLSAPASPDALGVPRCSPSGDYLAYSADTGDVWGLFVTDFSNTYQVYPNDSLITGYASWPAFGTDFIFQVITQVELKNVIYRLVGHPSAGQYSKVHGGGNPSLSPDGSHLVYSCQSNGNNRTLCVADVDGSNESELVEVIRVEVPGVGWGIQPASAWSADGQWLYFASAFDGDWDIYRIRLDGSDMQNLTEDWGSSNEVNPALKW